MVSEVQPSTLSGAESERLDLLRNLIQPHVGSFDYAMGQGLRLMRREIEPVILQPPDESSLAAVSISLEDMNVLKPDQGHRTASGSSEGTAKVLPRHAREQHATYKGGLFGTLVFRRTDNDEILERLTRRLGDIPVMVRSSKCNLEGLTPAELVRKNEEEYELGGYFVINGVEKVVRMVIVNRRHHVIGLHRSNNRNRGVLYSDAAVSMRCCRPDQSSKTNHLHYLTSGGVMLRITIRREEYFIPVVTVIRALLHREATDSDVFDRIVGHNAEDQYVRERAIAMIKDAADLHRGNRHQILTLLGSRFRAPLQSPPHLNNAEAGKQLLRQYVLVHLSTYHDEDESSTLDAAKVDMLVLMIKKLLALVRGEVMEDNPDALMNQEVLLPGHLYLIYLREKLEEYLKSISALFEKDVRGPKSRARVIAEFHTPKYLTSLISRGRRDITRKMEYFLATGNLQTQTGLDLLQASGYAVVAERINFWRFLAHFRCIHRGQFFNDVKTTSVRKLLPDAWGFICPVHTPDGAPCGLLNHLTAAATVSLDSPADASKVEALVGSLGALPPTKIGYAVNTVMKSTIPIVADGRVIGFVEDGESASILTRRLRSCKVDDNFSTLPSYTEVSHIPRRRGGPYAGVFLFSSPARLLRRVKWLRAGSAAVEESVGPFEQIHLRIRSAVRDDDGMEEEQEEGFSHEEISATGILSVLASFTPFSDMNQSPRNMYQCQMGKQALGTPCHMFERRSDSKTYRLLTGQTPIARNKVSQDPLGVDVFPNGINAVVAVLSYTGYDMEDAMVINKASLERGFCQAFIYTTTIVDLDETAAGKEKQFGCPEENDFLGRDGLPHVGAVLKQGDPLYAITDDIDDGEKMMRRTKVFHHKAMETATVDQVRLLAPSAGSENRGCRRAVIRLRYRRDPVIGDKFASRAGQKGTLSSHWPESDMPFSESGIIPDILFNPNGFPSRMTIGMMVESMCGKAGALHGRFQDSTPFRFDDKRRAFDYFGEQLLQQGFSFYGNETLYSGYTGEPFNVEIFTGVVQYQRLRHMVSDKFQVRSTGPINPLTRQPIRGRKVGGAIRFGEMERDALLGYGAAYLLHDRLSTSSDLHSIWVCANCRSVLSPLSKLQTRGPNSERTVTCKSCGHSNDQLKRVNLPYVFKYLANELAAMNIRTQLDVA